ncbi:hypothetical protein TcBrA4_0067000 [Trypanosoma cruzi]|nr:hypothetical protein TcBrA4_0067000 [Trypanosoma cruzi]
MLTTGAPSIPPPPTNPHRQRTAPPMLHPIFQIARRNRREGQWSLSANDARLWYDETPAVPLWASYTRRANEAARETWAPSTWEQKMSLAGQFATFCRTHERTMNEESCAVFLVAIEVAPSTRLRHTQDAAVHVGNGSNPAGHDDSGVTKNCGVIGKKAGELIDNGRDESSNPQPDRLEGTFCFSTSWMTASRWSGIAALTANSFTLEPDGAIILDWPVAPKTAKADLHGASRFMRTRGRDAFDTIKLCRTLQENEKLTNPTTAQVERALAPWNATVHSIKRGVLRHAAPIVETHNFDPHVISQLAVHVDSVDLLQDTVRYSGNYATVLTQVSSLVALM